MAKKFDQVELYQNSNFRKPKGAAAQKASRLKRLRDEANDQIEKKKIKVLPLFDTDYHIEQLVKAVHDGHFTSEELILKVGDKLAIKPEEKITNERNVTEQ